MQKSTFLHVSFLYANSQHLKYGGLSVHVSFHKSVLCVYHVGTNPIHTVLSAARLIDGGWHRHRSNSRNAGVFSVSFSAPCIFRREVFQNFPVINTTVLMLLMTRFSQRKPLGTLSSPTLPLSDCVAPPCDPPSGGARL